MKKSKIASKSKILMLLSLMFLSIAVLCMGVLAAESATYNIAGNISYNMVDYVARINTRVYKVEGQTDETGLATGVNTLATMTFEQIEKSTTTPYYILSQKLDTGAIKRTSDTTTEITKSVEIEYGAVDSSVEYYTFYVVINIKEITGDYLLSASLNETISSSTTSYKKSNQSQSAVTKNDTRNIVIGFSLKDATADSTESFSYTLTLTAVEGKDFSVTLIDGGTYWYIELGTLSDGTAIHWRLVSLDGEERYDYTSTQPTKHAGAIFVQETYTTTSVLNNSKSADNPYDGSVIQTYLKGLETYGSSNAYGITSDPGYIVSYTTTEGGNVCGDKFWLLSKTQASTFFADNLARKFYNGTSSVSWWLRTPYIIGGKYANVYYVEIDGSASQFLWSDNLLAVRAAFQLA